MNVTVLAFRAYNGLGIELEKFADLYTEYDVQGKWSESFTREVYFASSDTSFQHADDEPTLDAEKNIINSVMSRLLLYLAIVLLRFGVMLVGNFMYRLDSATVGIAAAFSLTNSAFFNVATMPPGVTGNGIDI